MGSTLRLKTILVGLAILLACGLRAGETKGWDFSYGVGAPGSKNETVYGKLLYRGFELPKSYKQVVTPIGEFVFVDAQGPVSNKEIGWGPYGALPGCLKGTRAFAHTRLDVNWLMDPSEENSRRVPNTDRLSPNRVEPSVPGTFENRPAVVESHWFFAVNKDCWIDPDYAWRLCGESLAKIEALYTPDTISDPDWLGLKDYLLITPDLANAKSERWPPYKKNGRGRVTIPFTIKNVSDKTITVHFINGELFGLGILNKTGKPHIFMDADSVMGSRVSSTVVLKPGATCTCFLHSSTDSLSPVVGCKIFGIAIGIVGDPPKAFQSYSAPFILPAALILTADGH
jgi:hypothetical protein